MCLGLTETPRSTALGGSGSPFFYARLYLHVRLLKFPWIRGSTPENPWTSWLIIANWLIKPAMPCIGIMRWELQLPWAIINAMALHVLKILPVWDPKTSRSDTQAGCLSWSWKYFKIGITEPIIYCITWHGISLLDSSMNHRPRVKEAIYLVLDSSAYYS